MPFSSKKQRGYFHFLESEGKISPKTVHEFDEASKGKKLPEYAPKKVKTVSFNSKLKHFLKGNPKGY